ncbi:MAG TPA: hypothetical protein VGR28_08820 [Candidatus Thermoplasmatota archaeon]|jgi:hypothetical protein|nr:hypothetical protein [Candidatus Thermoplasmatota archaeon]
MVGALEANAAAFVAVAVLGIGCLMLAVSALSWRRLRHPRLLFTTAAFAALALRGGLATWRAAQAQPPDLAAGALDLALVLLLYAVVAKR